MPKRLNRKDYGWSYTYAKDQRVSSDEYKKNFDKIKWYDIDTSEWEEKKNVFGKAKVKYY